MFSKIDDLLLMKDLENIQELTLDNNEITNIYQLEEIRCMKTLTTLYLCTFFAIKSWKFNSFGK